MSNKIHNRFETLIDEINLLKADIKKKSASGYTPSYLYFDNDEIFLEWKIKAKNLLKLSCGDDSVHYRDFLREEAPQSYDDNPTVFKRLFPILTAAFDDLKAGLLVSFKQIVQAEVFDSELEQAKSLLNSGYKNAAAVIAGTVLETAVKELCINHGVDVDRKKLTHLNDELAKLGIYNKLQQKQITALADIRNNAAHGDYDQFTQDHVVRMIEDIERFLLTYSS